MEALRQEDEILDAANLRIVELGAEIAQRLLDGKDSPDQMAQGKRILSLTRAYRDELEDKEKEAILYCLRKLSDKFFLPASAQGNVLGPLIPEQPEDPPFVDFYIGDGNDVEGYFGDGADVENFVGTT